MISSGRVSRGFVGIRPATVSSAIAEQLSLPSNQKGALVEQVTRGMPADKAGVRVGDVIIDIDGTPITSDSGMRRAIGETKPGTTVKMGLLRGGKNIVLPVTVEALDENALAASEQQAKQSMQKLGVAVDSVPREFARKLGLDDGEGVVVLGVARRGRFAGLKIGDVIVSVNGKSVSTAEDFVDAVSVVREGQPLKLVVKNEESDQMITIR